MENNPPTDSPVISRRKTSLSSSDSEHTPDEMHPSFNIVPDPRYYVVRPDDIYSKLKRMIETSRGGVIGLTGVRGAGKSVLLRKVEQTFKGKHHTLQITAPTSSNQETAFFVMLYRQLCDSIFSTINAKVFGKRFDALNVGLRESRGRTWRFRVVSAVAAIIFSVAIFMGYHSFAFTKEKDNIEQFIADKSMQHRQYVTDLTKKFENQLKGHKEAQSKNEKNQKAAAEALIQNLASQIERVDQSLRVLNLIQGLQEQLLNDLKIDVDPALIPHPAVIAYYEIFSEGGFNYQRNFIEPRELQKLQVSAVNSMKSKERIDDRINGFADQVRSEFKDLRESRSASALLTTITDGGRAEFNSVEKAIGKQKDQLTIRMQDFQTEITRAKNQPTSGDTTSISELFTKLDSLLESIPDEAQQVSMALEKLNADIETVVFKPMAFSTWTNLKLPQELARGSKSEGADNSSTINDSITDSVGAMASFFQFLDKEIEEALTDKYDLFVDAKKFDTRLRDSANEYRELIGYVPYIVLGFIVILTLGGLSLLVGLTWRRDREARRNKHALGLIRTTERVIRMLDYNITRSRSAQVQVPLLQKISGSLSISEQQQERSLTLPGLTAHYVKYIREVQDVLEKVYGSRKLIICIDELDKINDPQQVGNVLREIKGALYVEDCFYLLSISEDAVRAFEGRFVEERDIFESTFDEIMFLERLDLETCEKVAYRRIAEIGYDIGQAKNDRNLTEAIWIAGVVSTGVPREFLRNMRTIITEEHGVKNLNATSAWYALFRRKLLETFEKVRAVSGLEDFRAELIEDIERLITLTAEGTVEDGHELSSEISYNLVSTCAVITDLEDRLADMLEKLRALVGQQQETSLEDQRAELRTRINLIETWQRNWLELLIYLYTHKAGLRLTGTPELKKACKNLLGVYGMLPYSFARSKKLLDNHTQSHR